MAIKEIVVKNADPLVSGRNKYDVTLVEYKNENDEKLGETQLKVVKTKLNADGQPAFKVVDGQRVPNRRFFNFASLDDAKEILSIANDLG